MKALKQIFTGILCCTLTLVLVTNVTAQDRKEGPEDPEAKAEKQTMMMSKKLDLNDDQKNEVHEINMKYAEQSYELKQEMREEGDNEELKMRYKRMMKEKKSELKAVLNEEQVDRFEEMQKRKNEKKKGFKRDKKEMEEEEMEESEDY